MTESLGDDEIFWRVTRSSGNLQVNDARPVRDWDATPLIHRALAKHHCYLWAGRLLALPINREADRDSGYPEAPARIVGPGGCPSADAVTGGILLTDQVHADRAQRTRRPPAAGPG